jgi:cell wall-associated NlpC family hydrolase
VTRRLSFLTGAKVAATLLGLAAIGALAPAVDARTGPNKHECVPFVSAAQRTSATCWATIAADGRAVPPPGAPPPVREVIEAANRISNRPYEWGGGHLSWRSRGYDCSGAVGYALHGAGMLDYTMVSGQLAHWGEGGVGRWITVYANRHHVYMVVAGLRFDTRDGLTARTGPRWHTDRPRDPTRHFTARHPEGL